MIACLRTIRTANFHVRNTRCFLICFISDNFYILSLLKKFVNNFFYFFESFFEGCFSAALGANTGSPCRFKVFAAVISAANTNISYLFRPVNKFFLIFLHFSYLSAIPKKMEAFPASKRRKRDLNPRAAINDLLPFQGSPFGLLGISPNAYFTVFSI